MIAIPDTSPNGPRIPESSETPTPDSEAAELPLFEPDSPCENGEEESTVEQGPPPPHFPPPTEDQPIMEQTRPSPSPSTPLPPLTNSVDNHESQALEEMQEQFQWLVDMVGENQRRSWGTGYRDFADISLLLHAVRGLGMAVRGNNRISKGQFCASTGNYILDLPTFIDAMGLGSSNTWRNKLTMYFRLKSLYSYSEHNGGVCFQSPTHQAAWNIVSCWVRDEDKLLPESWITTKYGNTQLKVLVREMLQEAYQSQFSTVFF